MRKCKNCGQELIKLRGSKHQKSGWFHNNPNISVGCTNPEPEAEKLICQI